MSHHQLVDLLRRLGLIAQLVGLATTAWGIHATRKQFDPTWRPLHVRVWPRVHRFLDWLINYPQERKDVNVIGATANISISAGVGAVNVVVDPDDLVRRVENLEAVVSSIRDEHRRLQAEAHGRIDSLAESADRERVAHETALRRVEDSLVRLATGGVRLSAWGVTLLACGVVLSTVPSGVANAIGR